MKMPRVLPALATTLLFAAALFGASPSADAEDAAPALGGPRGDAALPPQTPQAREELGEPVAVARDGMAWTEAPDIDEASADIAGTILVDARDDLDGDAISALAQDFGLRFAPSDLEAETRIEIAKVDAASEGEMLERLSKDPRVEYAEPLSAVKASFVPNDPMMGEQWHLERIGASRAWDFATGRGVTVAVVDTGIACEDHGPYSKGSDLATTECLTGWNFVDSTPHANDDQGHGTHVAGTIAQSTNNGLGVAGVAFHARLLPVKVLNQSGWGTTADVADGIRWAADNGAQVINLSLGGPRNARVLQKAIDHALSRGVVVVAAAGNTGGRVQYPGASDGVIGVSAIDAKDKLAAFSSRGEGVDIAAPGVNVVQQTICNGGRDKCQRYAGFNGTSMAAPHVAGAAALVMSLGVTEPSAVEDALRKNARVVDDSEAGKALYGAGILQAADAVVNVTKTHAIVRLVGLLVLAFFIGRSAKKKNADALSPFRPDFLIPALIAGPGLFFFAPWILPRVSLAVDLLARPLPDLDLLVGVSVHRFLPLANALIPFGLTALFFGIRRARPVIAGLATGLAAYLVSVAALGEASGPFGHTALVAWCAVNAIACAWIARTNLAESR